MRPILNVEYREGRVVRQEINDLSSGLRKAFDQLGIQSTHGNYDELVILLDPLTIESMRKLRNELPGLHVTAHFLTPADSQILDKS